MTNIVEQWQICELAFESGISSPNPFLDIVAATVFTGPNGRTIVREAYWDGGKVWKIRFAPTEIGEWTYVIQGLFLEPVRGSLQCVPYSGDVELYQHGFIKIGSRGQYLTYADDQPFFWLGDTHWEFVTKERWNESNCETYTSQFRASVDKRIEQRFTVYQCNFQISFSDNPAPESQAAPYFVASGNGLLPNIDYFQNNVDPKMNYLAEKGLVIAAGLAWFAEILKDHAIEDFKHAARYLIARYGAHPMVWTLAGEVAGYNLDKRQRSIDGWRQIALQIQELDSYGHLQTAHYTNERPFPDYYQGESWFDFALNQAGHGDLPIDSRYYQSYRARFPATPLIEGESLYEGALTFEANGRRRVNSEMMRRAAYLAFQCGACGYTYGAQGFWHFQWHEPENPDDWGFLGSFPPWYKSLAFEGANHLKIMRDFYERAGWQNLAPLGPDRYHSDMLFAGCEDFRILFTPLASASPDMKTIVIYFSSNNFRTSTLSSLTQTCYTAQWVNPATGEETLIDADVRPQAGVWRVPAKPVAGDILLLLTAH